MWKHYRIDLHFTGRLCASTPQSKDLVPAWLDSRKPATKPTDARPLGEIQEEVEKTIEDLEERTTLGFQRADLSGNGNRAVLVVRGGTIKAHLKDCANQIKEIANVKSFRAKVANRVYIDEYWVPLQRNGEYVSEEDDSFEQPVHIITPKGPRSALKVVRFVEQPSLSFTLKLLENKEVTEVKVARILDYGSVHGYGGERGMGEGRYTYQMKEITE